MKNNASGCLSLSRQTDRSLSLSPSFSSSLLLSVLSPSYSDLSFPMTKLLSVRSLTKQRGSALFIKHLYHVQRWHTHTQGKFWLFSLQSIACSLSLSLSPWIADLARFVIWDFSLCHHGDLLLSWHDVMIGPELGAWCCVCVCKCSYVFVKALD